MQRFKPSRLVSLLRHIKVRSSWRWDGSSPERSAMEEGGGALTPLKREEGRCGGIAEGTKVRKRAEGETAIPLRPRPTKDVTSPV